MRMEAPRNPVTMRAMAPCVALALAACGGVARQLAPSATQRVQRTQVVSVIPEEHITLQWMTSGYGVGGSLLGALFAAGAESGRRQKAARLAEPLRALTADIRVRRRYRSMLDDVTREVPWLKATRVEPMKALLEVESPDVHGRSLLRIGTDYNLSPDGSVFILTSGFGFYDEGDTDIQGANLAIYHSERIGDVEDEAALELWCEMGAQRYRSALEEGLAEHRKLMRMALEHLGGVVYGGPVVELEVQLLHARGDYGITKGLDTIEGTVVEEGADRLIVQTEEAFMSLPKSAVFARTRTGTAAGMAWHAPREGRL